MLRVGVGYSTQGWRKALTDYATTFVDHVAVVTLRDPSTIAESAIDVLLVDQASVLFTPDVVRRAAVAKVPVVGVTERWDEEIDAAFTPG